MGSWVFFVPFAFALALLGFIMITERWDRKFLAAIRKPKPDLSFIPVGEALQADVRTSSHHVLLRRVHHWWNNGIHPHICRIRQRSS